MSYAKPALVQRLAEQGVLNAVHCCPSTVAKGMQGMQQQDWQAHFANALEGQDILELKLQGIDSQQLAFVAAAKRAAEQGEQQLIGARLNGTSAIEEQALAKARQAGADFVVLEQDNQQALASGIAACQRVGITAVVSLAVEKLLAWNQPIAQSLEQLSKLGAQVVGVDGYIGPQNHEGLTGHWRVASHQSSLYIH